jgi:hypothetical protein
VRADIQPIMQAWLEAIVREELVDAQPGSLSYRRAVVGAPEDLVAVLTYRLPAGAKAALIQSCDGCWTVLLGLDVREAVRRARLIALPYFSIPGGQDDRPAVTAGDPRAT